MADAFTTVTTFINSPPGVLVTGATLGTFVSKAFDRIEGLLKDSPKTNIAVWLAGLRVSPKAQPFSGWPVAFLAICDVIFVTPSASWRGFRRSLLVTLCSYVASAIVNLDSLVSQMNRTTASFVAFLIALPLAFALVTLLQGVPDYFCFLATRRMIRWAFRHRLTFLCLLLSFILALVYAVIVALVIVALGLTMQIYVYNQNPVGVPPGTTDISSMGGATIARHAIGNLIAFFPFFFLFALLALYMVSGSILRFANRFDSMFGWLNRYCDIEKKPLQTIGLVSGAFVAILYWAFAIVHRF